MINAVSNGLFGQGAIGFLFPKMGASPTMVKPMGYTSPVVYAGGSEVSINEFWLPAGTTTPAIDQVKANFKANWVTMGIQMVLIPASFRLGKQLARPAIRQTNRLLKQVKLDKVVTV